MGQRPSQGVVPKRSSFKESKQKGGKQTSYSSQRFIWLKDKKGAHGWIYCLWNQIDKVRQHRREKSQILKPATQTCIPQMSRFNRATLHFSVSLKKRKASGRYKLGSACHRWKFSTVYHTLIKRVHSLVRLDKIETSFAMLSAPNQRACAQLDELRQAEKARMEKLLFVRLVKKLCRPAQSSRCSGEKYRAGKRQSNIWETL